VIRSQSCRSNRRVTSSPESFCVAQCHLGLDTNLTAVGFRLNRDTRPNRFYPTSGTFLDFTADFFTQGLGSKYSFQSYKINLNKYWNLTQNQVLASGSFACFTGGAPPFYGNCICGGGGVRFELSKRHHVNLCADFAQDKDSHTWSMGVGEAF